MLFAIVREDAVVADAGEVAREKVPAEAGEELGASEFARLDPVVIGIVTVSKADGASFGIELLEAGVGDGNAMGVVGEISYCLLGSAEGSLEVDSLVLVVERAEAGEAQTVRPVQLRLEATEADQELATEENAQGGFGKKVALLLWP